MKTNVIAWIRKLLCIPTGWCGIDGYLCTPSPTHTVSALSHISYYFSSQWAYARTACVYATAQIHISPYIFVCKFSWTFCRATCAQTHSDTSHACVRSVDGERESFFFFYLIFFARILLAFIAIFMYCIYYIVAINLICSRLLCTVLISVN